MASLRTLVTTRDLDVLQALEMTPLSARQLLRLSKTFPPAFTDERKLRARLQILRERGQVHQWPYVIAGRGMPCYYTLARRGYALLHGPHAAPPPKRAFREIAISRQQHTFALAEFLVHTAIAAHRGGTLLQNVGRENSVRLDAGEDHLYPDCSFTLVPPDGRTLRFFVELDNGTERVRSAKDADSWDRKIHLYEATQDQSADRFRVLVIATRGSDRLTHILTRAATLTQNPLRTLFYGIELPCFLAEAAPLTTPCFRDHRLEPAALVPALRVPAPPSFHATPVLLARPATVC
jgi:hypothetical protein